MIRIRENREAGVIPARTRRRDGFDCSMLIPADEPIAIHCEKAGNSRQKPQPKDLPVNSIQNPAQWAENLKMHYAMAYVPVLVCFSPRGISYGAF